MPGSSRRIDLAVSLHQSSVILPRSRREPQRGKRWRRFLTRTWRSVAVHDDEGGDEQGGQTAGRRRSLILLVCQSTNIYCLQRPRRLPGYLDPDPLDAVFMERTQPQPQARRASNGRVPEHGKSDAMKTARVYDGLANRADVLQSLDEALQYPASNRSAAGAQERQ